MQRRIGLCGSHRTGKTTLAKTLAEELHLPFIQTQIQQVFEQLGLDPAAKMDFNTRLEVQEYILISTKQIWQAAPSAFVTDRTPIDFMAYLLGDIQGETVVNFTNLQNYLLECFNTINQLFTRIVVLQPAIPLVFAQGKASLNKAYIEHLNALILGLCHDERLHCPVTVIPREVVDLHNRLKLISI